MDKMLRRLGLMRISQQSIKKMEYDYRTGQIFIVFSSPLVQRIVGFVCPTPDGPLKRISNPPNSFFTGGSDV